METTFAEIEALTDQALDRHYQHPPVKPTFKVVAGSCVRDHDCETAQIDQHRLLIGRLRERRSEILAKLAKVDVTPLAVVPTPIWNRICAEARLDQFSPDRNGQIPVSTDDARIVITAGRILSTLFWLTPLASWGWWAFHLSQGETEICAFSAAGLAFIYTLLLATSAFIAVHKAFTLGLGKLYDWLPRQWILHRLVRPPADLGRRRARLMLPTPPDEILAILERSRSVYGDLHRVAIPPGGWSLAESPSEIIRPRLTNAVRDRARSWQQWRDTHLDPIIYVEDNGLTVIIAQYGPFAIEREAVEAALAAEDQI